MKTIFKKMSNSLASAKRRRANMQPDTVSSTPPPVPTSNSQPQQQKLTIPAYLSLLEGRLLQLEKRVDGSDGSSLMVETAGPDGVKNTMKITDYMEDMDKRFQMLAEEITNMKDIVLSLQRYTMEVNQNLLSQMTSPNANPNPNLESLQPPIEEELEQTEVDESNLSNELQELLHGENIKNEVEIK